MTCGITNFKHSGMGKCKEVSVEAARAPPAICMVPNMAISMLPECTDSSRWYLCIACSSGKEAARASHLTNLPPH